MAEDLVPVRDRLAARHTEVLAALLAGEVPPGFDVRTTTAAGAQLRARRRHDVATVRPVLAGLPSLGPVFDAYARTAPRAGCAHADADAFCTWLADADLPRATADWVALARVGSGARRWALVHEHGRRVLALGLGHRVVHLALRGAVPDEVLPTRGGAR